MRRGAAPAAWARRRTTAPPLPQAFYDRDPEVVARELLGAVMLCRTPEGLAGGRIVETEAYLGPHDPACHAAAGLTARNRALFGPPGHAYVYLIYGMHWCVNAVTREEGFGSAVLIRALEPLVGIDLMRARRRMDREIDLVSGPGKLCQALGIDRRLDGVSLDSKALRIVEGSKVATTEIAVSPRIGIVKAADWPLRFYVRGNPHVSRARIGG